MVSTGSGTGVATPSKASIRGRKNGTMRPISSPCPRSNRGDSCPHGSRSLSRTVDGHARGGEDLDDAPRTARGCRTARRWPRRSRTGRLASNRPPRLAPESASAKQQRRQRLDGVDGQGPATWVREGGHLAGDVLVVGRAGWLAEDAGRLHRRRRAQPGTDSRRSSRPSTPPSWRCRRRGGRCASTSSEEIVAPVSSLRRSKVPERTNVPCRERSHASMNASMASPSDGRSPGRRALSWVVAATATNATAYRSTTAHPGPGPCALACTATVRDALDMAFHDIVARSATWSRPTASTRT